VVNGHEYRITVAFKQRIEVGKEFADYARLYWRVNRLAKIRLTELKCRNGESLHTWIASQGWGSLGAPYNFATAFVTLGLIGVKPSTAKPYGEPTPTPESLMSPRGAILRAAEPGGHSPHADEIYNEFDLTEPSTSETTPVMVSYGERISGCQNLNFEPFVNKAEEFANAYYEFLKAETRIPHEQLFKILGREWYTVANPDLAVVHVHFLA
jgi:hypothetical protein